MNRKAHLPPRYLLAVFIVIVFHIFLAPYALGEEVVKGKVDVPFETGFSVTNRTTKAKRKLSRRRKRQYGKNIQRALDLPRQTHI